MTEQQGWPAQHIPPQPAPPHVPLMQRPFGYAVPPVPPAIQPLPPRRRRVGLSIAAVAAVIALSAGSAVAGGFVALQLHPDTSHTSAVAGGNATTVDPTSLASVAAAVLPSVVSIQTGSTVGSGVVVTADGAILTNRHVVSASSGRVSSGGSIQVTFNTGKTATATIVGTDSSNDLAVIKVANVSGLTPLAFGDSDDVHVGDTVLAIGSPLGLEGSVTSGIVSALNRKIDESPSISISGAIQTDAAINPGNSGGPLVNTSGHLIGINTAIASTSENAGSIGVGFAISSNVARRVTDRILNG